jgi:hypothetical protein
MEAKLEDILRHTKERCHWWQDIKYLFFHSKLSNSYLLVILLFKQICENLENSHLYVF